MGQTPTSAARLTCLDLPCLDLPDQCTVRVGNDPDTGRRREHFWMRQYDRANFAVARHQEMQRTPQRSQERMRGCSSLGRSASHLERHGPA
jgi:hypothetical protein